MPTWRPAMATPDLALLDEERLGRVAARRAAGSASKAQDVAQAHVLDVVALGRRAAAARARARRGALPDRHAQHLPARARRAPGRRGLDGRAALDEIDGATVYDAFADPQALRRSSAACSPTAPPSTGEHATVGLPLDRGRRAARARRAGARPMGAEQSNSSIVLDDALRPEGLPPPGGGRQPRARDAALPDRARLPEHRRADRLVRLHGRAHGRDARRRAGLRRGRARRLGARARRARPATPEALRRAGWRTLGAVIGEMHSRAGLRRDRPRVRARGAEPGVDRR